VLSPELACDLMKSAVAWARRYGVRCRQGTLARCSAEQNPPCAQLC